MTEDARFEDGAERPLRLRAESPEDLAVISALVQDAVAQASEIAWTRRRQHRPFERVRAVLAIDGVLRARASGVDPGDRDVVLSLLALGFEPGEDGAGILRLTLAGDGEIALEVECLDVTLADVTRPYAAPSGKRPSHANG